MIKYWVGLTIVTIVILVIPYNKIKYVEDQSGIIRLSRLERSSVLFSYGTFFTPGRYESLFIKPVSFINPVYANAGPFSDGCFELFAEFKGDTVIVYEGTFCKSKNLTSKFQLVRVSNAFGNLSWLALNNDTTGKYLSLTCAE